MAKGQIDHGLRATLQKYAHLVNSAARPLPTQTGDGTYMEEDTHSSIVQDLSSLRVSDINTVIQLLERSISGNKLTNDRTLFMEHLVGLASKLPDSSTNRAKLTNAFTKDIWTTLDHPPPCALGDLYNYRQADGSYNNINLPNLGKAGTPYARSVKPRAPSPPSRPDPGLLFDTIMSRDNGGFKPHPGNISSMLFYLATLIIHDCFRTSRENPNISTTSSYLDLSPLYGADQAEQNQMRTFENGRLKPDSFAEKRILGFPPGVSCLVIMFNRFHNYVVTQLAAINENGRFDEPSSSLSDEHKRAANEKRDNDLFQTGRLITCGLYAHIILRDYVRTILNINRTNSTWWIDPRADIGDGDRSMGTGNQVSFEFNLVYRWHSCVSQRDEEWTQRLYENIVGKDYRETTTRELLTALATWEAEIPDDPLQRSFENLTRQDDGTFNDDDLVRILTDSVEDLAGAFGANNIPPILRAIEVLGILQARSWHAASLNEFRSFFGLEPHKTFEDINSDPVVAAHLKSLYEHPDYVEMYPGVVIEENKPTVVPGSGLATGYSISRAILSDAITLTRGDRHLTQNYHPGNLTNWGMKEVEADPAVEEGCVIYKLFIRAFPHHFEFNSVYAHYPFVIPSENKKILKSLGRVDSYSFRRPTRRPLPIPVMSIGGVDAALMSKTLRVDPWKQGFQFLGGQDGARCCLAGDGQFYAGQRATLQKSMYPDSWKATVKRFYETTSAALLKNWSSPIGVDISDGKIKQTNGHSAKSAGTRQPNGHFVKRKTYQVDIVRDVGNLAGVHFAAQFWAMPLKTAERPHGIFTEHELKDILTLMFTVVFYGTVDPAKTTSLYTAAKPINEAMGAIMIAEVEAAGKSRLLGNLVGRLVGEKPEMKEFGIHAIRRLLENSKDAHEVVYAHILPAAAPMVTLNGAIFAQIVDFYLGAGKEHWPKIQELALQDTPEADELLMHYAMEGVRLNGSNSVLRCVHEDTTLLENGQPLHLRAGDTVYVSFNQLTMDPELYPEPEKVRLDRDIDSYRFYGHGPHLCLGSWISHVSQAAMLKVVGRLRNLRRAPGPQGQLKTITGDLGVKMYMDALQSTLSPFPTTMKVLYDDTA
ncbi:heme peroxidase [Truncatella angustata]|uniref:Heme peroxidase n=1 Tax=Truncatella angustata TaxID=152316 RepID=A0A9P8UFE5_9PEZI|nr:heme peroxidase [Truncatella angustata]KAH6648976.1 heme peroxidase [Truncatella angustata]KAH8200749.1 hypothetical protein TruAng_005066 [Truncatella angustata]